MAEITNWLTKHSLQDPNDHILVKQISRQLESNDPVSLQSNCLKRSLGICKEVSLHFNEQIVWINLAGCTSGADALLCIAESLGTYQGDESLLIDYCQKKTVLLIVLNPPEPCYGVLSRLNGICQNIQWLFVSNEQIPWTIHCHTIVNNKIKSIDQSTIYVRALLNLPGGLPVQETENNNLIPFLNSYIVDPLTRRSNTKTTASKELIAWICKLLQQHLQICDNQNLPKETTAMHLFALRWLNEQSKDVEIIQRSSIAIAKILQAWNQPERSIIHLQNTPLGTENPNIIISYNIIQIKCHIAMGHWVVIPAICKRTIQVLRSTSSIQMRAEFQRQLAAIYALWGRFVLAEKELYSALLLTERAQCNITHSRVLRDIAALGISNNESITPQLLLEQVDYEVFSADDFAHFLITKSELLFCREKKQPAEIALNQAESIDNETPLSIANRQRRRATISFASGKYEAAIQLAEKAALRFSFCGEHISQAHSMRLIADVYASQGKGLLAYAKYKQTLLIQTCIRDDQGIQRTLRHLEVLLQHHRSHLQTEVTELMKGFGS
jgi:tetratricopeptide (TPR) repeat protein